MAGWSGHLAVFEPGLQSNQLSFSKSCLSDRFVTYNSSKHTSSIGCASGSKPLAAIFRCTIHLLVAPNYSQVSNYANV